MKDDRFNLQTCVDTLNLIVSYNNWALLSRLMDCTLGMFYHKKDDVLLYMKKILMGRTMHL
jgi:hypothetical protein